MKFEHQCPEWDFLKINENQEEITACLCFDSDDFEAVQKEWENKTWLNNEEIEFVKEALSQWNKMKYSNEILRHLTPIETVNKRLEERSKKIEQIEYKLNRLRKIELDKSTIELKKIDIDKLNTSKAAEIIDFP